MFRPASISVITDDADEAVEIASTEIESLRSYHSTMQSALRSFVWQARSISTTQAPSTALRLASGMDTLLDDLKDQYPSSLSSDAKATVPVHRRKSTEIDALAGEMLAHALAFEGIAAVSQPAASVNANYLAKLDLKGADIVCLQLLRRSSDPARHAGRRPAKTMARCACPRSGAMECAGGTVDRRILETLNADAVVTSVEEVRRTFTASSTLKKQWQPNKPQCLTTTQSVLARLRNWGLGGCQT